MTHALDVKWFECTHPTILIVEEWANGGGKVRCQLCGAWRFATEMEIKLMTFDGDTEIKKRKP